MTFFLREVYGACYHHAMHGENARHEIEQGLSRINDFIVAEFIVALEALGVLAYAAKHFTFAADRAADEFHLDKELFQETLEYLSEEGIFEVVKAEVFRLAVPYPPLKFMANSVLVNKRTVEALAPLIKGALVYGRDIVKNDRYLKNTEGLILGAVPILVARIKELRSTRVVDIGCGRGLGMFLRALAEAMPAVHGIGVEPDADALHETREAIRTSAHDANLSVIEGHPEHPEKLPAKIRDADMLVELGIFHEYRGQQEEKMIPLLERYKRCFPRARFFAVEPDEVWREPPEIDEYMVPFYRFVHSISNQGFPRSQEDWGDVLTRAGWNVVATHKLPLNLVAYECE